MHTKLVLTLCITALLIGCSKQEQDPSSLAANYFKYLQAHDTANLVSLYVKDIQSQLISSDTLHNIKHHFDAMDGIHFDIKVGQTKIDPLFPDMAKIYFSGKTSGRQTLTLDSIFFLAAKEDGQWKLSAEFPRREIQIK
jgi:hypothetical protein